ncbi:hypothetical protein CERZMDRAFT_85569 [Cercospora zeae-maydis SCOH1-5]|uniref:Uncharacterized protein n=1 Tax=Cercospora zeae-maydis SCOH1-5 TaxID=717836 RepID=A0A6A6FD87_9PEZI|nr:hypothetical protein CERZMDRAFT_85569 [Cercospora zeae-maydis SCOH1-5]
MAARLIKYGIDRPFRLAQDLNQQDQLSTWIEYLGYEHYFYDRAATYVSRSQQEHDRAWEKLVSLGVLRPEETYEVLCDVETGFQHEKERHQAKQAAHLAAILHHQQQPDTATKLARAENDLRLQIVQLEREKSPGNPPVIDREDKKSKPHNFRLESHKDCLTFAPLLPSQQRKHSKRSRSETIDIERPLKRSKKYHQGDVAGI